MSDRSESPETKRRLIDHLEEIEYYHSKIKKFYMDQHVSKFVLRNSGEYPEEELAATFERIIDRAYYNTMREGRSPKMFGLLLFGHGLESPICIPTRTREQNRVEVIMNEIDVLEISNKKWNFLDNPVNIIITILSSPYGKGKAKNFNAKSYFGTKERHRIRVQNNDEYCLFYALELARLYHDQRQITELKKIGQDIPSYLMKQPAFYSLRRSKKKQRFYAMKLIEEAEIDPDLDEYGIEHLKMVQEFYDDEYPSMYRIILIDDSTDYSPLWAGPIGRKYDVALYLENGHYDGLKSIAAFFGHRKYCPGKLNFKNTEKIILDCSCFYKEDSRHDVGCKARCYGCGLVKYGNCKEDCDISITCDNCARVFRNHQCYENHKNAMCKKYHNCTDCNRVYRTDSAEHVCGELYCRICHVYHDPDRGCYIEPIKKEKGTKPSIIAVFDFEVYFLFNKFIIAVFRQHKICKLIKVLWNTKLISLVSAGHAHYAPTLIEMMKFLFVKFVDRVVKMMKMLLILSMTE